MDEHDADDNDETEEKEPQVTSSDPNERKLARKLRIERRLEAIRKLNLPEGEEVEEVEQKTLLQEQLQKSLEILEKLTVDGNELVTNVRVANDSRETDRREAEGINREKVIAELEEEAEKAEEQFNVIAEKWISIFDYHDPLHINDDIGQQKEKCDELIHQKDEVIAMLKTQIRTAEINFTKDQRKQTEDIEILASRIEKQVVLMRRAYRHELQMIEDVIETERKMLLEVTDKKWEELYKKRDQEEDYNSEKKFEQLEEFEELCNDLRVDHQEKFRHTKIKLENEIEALQRELEEIKIMCLMNSEKLDYNYQILKKREDENIIIKSQQKRRINKCQDMINELKIKSSEYETRTNSEIERLTADIKKLKWNILDIEEAADHFSRNNDIKYKQVWEMNLNIANGLLNQILTADKVLHEQQLGLDWTDPEQKLLEMRELPSYISAVKVVSELRKKDKDEKKSKNKKCDEEEEEESLTPKGETIAHRRILRIILQQIADRSGFLIEGKLKEILKEHLVESEVTLIKVDSCFSALGIKRPEDIEVLLEFFLPYTECPICSMKKASSSEIEIKAHNLDNASPTSTNSAESESSPSKNPSIAITNITGIISVIQQPHELIEEIITNLDDGNSTSSEVEEEEQKNPSLESSSVKSEKHSSKCTAPSQISCHYRHPLVINHIYILRALKEFVSKFYVAKKGITTMASRLSHKRSTVSRLMLGEDVKMFWNRFRVIFSPARVALWDGLMIGLNKYHAILKDRRELNDEVVVLRRQNEELKYLLSCYQKDLKKKMTPPCAINRQQPIQPTNL